MPKLDYKKTELKELIQLAQINDIKALEELLRRIQSQVYSMFAHLTNKKEDILDLTQETLLKLAKSISKLKDVNNFKQWMNQIIINTYNDFLRKSPNKYIEFDETTFEEIKDKIGCEPGERYFFTEIEKLIKNALLTLPKDLRITLVLREYEGLSYEDISKLTNTAIGTVKSRISRARNKLQQELKEFI